MLKILIDYPKLEDELHIVDMYTRVQTAVKLKKLLSGDSLILLQKLTRQVPVANDIKKRAVDIVAKTRNFPDLIEYGASPRASLGIILATKAKALIDGRKYVSIKDIEQMAYPVLRHRIVLSFKAERENMTPDQVVAEVLKKA